MKTDNPSKTDPRDDSNAKSNLPVEQQLAAGLAAPKRRKLNICIDDPEVIAIIEKYVGMSNKDAAASLIRYGHEQYLKTEPTIHNESAPSAMPA